MRHHQWIIIKCGRIKKGKSSFIFSAFFLFRSVCAIVLLPAFVSYQWL